MTTQKRVFAPEFKRETVALLERSGRPLAHIAAEVGIMPSMLQAWSRSTRSGPLSQAVSAGAIAPLPSPADQASQITKLKRELVRTRMERDILNVWPAPSARGKFELA